jgi:hypothetical protein
MEADEMIEIKHRVTGEVIHTVGADTFVGANLYSANLRGGNEAMETFVEHLSRQWWHFVGSGIRPKDGESQEEFARRVAHAAVLGAFMGMLEEDSSPEITSTTGGSNDQLDQD